MAGPIAMGFCKTAHFSLYFTNTFRNSLPLQMKSHDVDYPDNTFQNTIRRMNATSPSIIFGQVRSTKGQS